MATTAPVLRISRLRKRTLAELKQRAESDGITVERYVEKLIEQDLALERKARTTTFAELMGPGRNELDEAELDRLVDRARTQHHERTRRR